MPIRLCLHVFAKSHILTGPIGEVELGQRLDKRVGIRAAANLPQAGRFQNLKIIVALVFGGSDYEGALVLVGKEAIILGHR